MLKRLLAHPLIAQMLRFASVGVVGTALHYCVLIGLVELAHVRPVFATIAGYLCGAVFSYTLNRAFTFDHRPAYRSGLAKYVALVGIGLGLNALIVGLLTHLSVYYLIAQVLATGLVFFYNFSAARWGVFRAPRAPPPAPDS